MRYRDEMSVGGDFGDECVRAVGTACEWAWGGGWWTNKMRWRCESVGVNSEEWSPKGYSNRVWSPHVIPASLLAGV